MANKIIYQAHTTINNIKTVMEIEADNPEEAVLIANELLSDIPEEKVGRIRIADPSGYFLRGFS